MICGYWGIHAFIRREVFHLLVWCFSSLSNRRSWPVCFLSMERRCVPRRSCRAINQSLPLSLSLSGEEPNAKLERCAASSHLLLQQTHFTSLKICKTVTQCVRQSMRKHTLKSQQTAVKPHNSPCLSSCIFKAECSLWI